MATRILIVDDHALVRDGTRQLLEKEPELEVVGEAGRAEEALELARRLQPDLVLLDLALPDLNGIEVARRLREITPQTKVIVLSAYTNETYVRTALEAGAVAYLPKTVRGQEVIEAIAAVRGGQVILHPTVAATLQHALQRGGSGRPALSAREREILQLAARGASNKAIAEELFLSVRTVESHLSHTLAKLGVASRAEAVAYGVSQGWISFDEAAISAEPAAPDAERAHRD
ncbi:MAG TPA: response regulator transcription factor [Nitrolancea sp.]|nr:response regulator transcription factor [Nitrolancea sp.]